MLNAWSAVVVVWKASIERSLWSIPCPPRLLGYGAEQDDIVLILGQDRLEDFLVVILGKLDVLKAPWHISVSVLVYIKGDVLYAWNNTLSHMKDVSTSSANHQNNNSHTTILKKATSRWPTKHFSVYMIANSTILRKDHLIMNYTHKIDRLPIGEQEEV